MILFLPGHVEKYVQASVYFYLIVSMYLKKLPKNVQFDYRDLFGYEHYFNRRFRYIVSPYGVVARYLKVTYNPKLFQRLYKSGINPLCSSV